MKHNPHPHGERVVQPHQLKDHLAEQTGKIGLGKVAKLPDAHRETHRTEHPYPNSMNPNPPNSEKVD